MDNRSGFRTVIPPLLALLLCAGGAVSSASPETVPGLAVTPLAGMGITANEASTLTELLHTSVSRILQEPFPPGRERFSLLERSRMDHLLDQYRFQDLGGVDVASAVEFGKMLSVQRIIVGSAGRIGETCFISVRMVDVETSRVIRSVSRTREGNIDGVIDLLPLVGCELLTGEHPPDPLPLDRMREAADVLSLSGGETEEAAISIEGTPLAARALIDSQYIGLTPVRNYPLAPGRYTVTVCLEGFRETAREVVIAPGERRRFSYTMAAHGALVCRGTPEGAEITVDGRSAGTAPREDLSLSPGRHTVRFSLPGYTTMLRDVTILPGMTRELVYTLSARPRISVETLPEGVEVLLDGDRAGETPLLDFTLAADDYLLTLRRDGYETIRERIAVDRDIPLHIERVLVPKTGRRALLRSAALPGYGQRYSGRPAAAFRFAALQSVTLAGGAVTRRGNDLRAILFGAAAAVYLLNLLDAAIISPQ